LTRAVRAGEIVRVSDVAPAPDGAAAALREETLSMLAAMS
jgi:hypothetical protein